ncbi:MAG: hypothetical protein ABMB14_18740, partial [Myxococcota bacterium]
PQIGSAIAARIHGYVVGARPLGLSFVGGFVDEDGSHAGAGAAAYTEARPREDDGGLGLVIATDGPWTAKRTAWATGTPQQAECALVAGATQLLHEIVHVAADGHGGRHDPDPDACWDEPRMVDTAFREAIADRFGDLPGCASLGDDRRFLGSAVFPSWAQIRRR